MKNKKKIIIRVILVIFLIVFLREVVAIIFDRSPFVIRTEQYDGGEIYLVESGVFVERYYCIDGTVNVVFRWQEKVCTGDAYKVMKIVDETPEDIDMIQVVEDFYEDDKYVYSFGVPKSQYIKVYYINGGMENIKIALDRGHIDISELDRFDIKYFKTRK